MTRFVFRPLLWVLARTGYRVVRMDEVRQKSYWEQLVDFLEKHSSLIKGNVLDIGTGTWTWPKDRFKRQCNIKTFDQFSYENVDIVGDLLELSAYVESDYFDVVLCLDTLEHVRDPFRAMEQMYGVLKLGGAFLASTPFLKNLHGEEYGDYWRFTRQGLKVLTKNFHSIEIFWSGEELLPKAYFVKAIK